MFDQYHSNIYAVPPLHKGRVYIVEYVPPQMSPNHDELMTSWAIHNKFYEYSCLYVGKG